MKRIMFFAILVFLPIYSASAASLSLNQAGATQVDLMVSDVSPYVLAGFDVDISYDPFGSGVSDVAFGDRLGDPANPLETFAMAFDDFFGTLNLFEVSSLASDALAGLQSGLSSFTLATINFLDEVDVNSLFISRSDLALESASVPEPATLLLFGSGLAGLAALRRRKKV